MFKILKTRALVICISVIGVYLLFGICDLVLARTGDFIHSSGYNRLDFVRLCLTIKTED